MFVCPYRTLNVFTPTQNDKPRNKLWDRDVVEMFLGDDWNNIRHYREFEIAPTADWIDLAIDLDKKNYDRSWRSGWRTMARIDEQRKLWYAAARIPLASVTTQPVVPGTRWRVNLYRIEGRARTRSVTFCAGSQPAHQAEIRTMFRSISEALRSEVRFSERQSGTAASCAWLPSLRRFTFRPFAP